MSKEIDRVKAAHIEELQGLVKAQAAITEEFIALLRYWKADLNPKDEPPAKEFDNEPTSD